MEDVDQGDSESRLWIPTPTHFFSRSVCFLNADLARELHFRRVSDGHLTSSSFGLWIGALLFVRAKNRVLILYFRQSAFLQDPLIGQS